MATIAIGDVHGNRAALDDLLARLEGELDVDDTVVFLGDYIDRGPDSKGCIDSILLPYEAFLDAMPPEHLAFFEGLKSFWRTADGVCVHGGLDPRRGSVETQTREAMIWGTSTFLTD